MEERLDKILSSAGICSRSEAKSMVKNGRILINGSKAASSDMKISREDTDILVDGIKINTNKYRYFILNKPAGVLSATEDRNQNTVLDLLKGTDKNLGLFPVGRLDKDTTGLLILTNDGNLAHKIISPSSKIIKKYYAVVDGYPDKDDIEAFKHGLVLSDGMQCLPAKLEIIGNNECYVYVMEGKYHQVKRMLASRGKPVLTLERKSIGSLELPQQLERGEYVEIEYVNLLDAVYTKHNC